MTTPATTTAAAAATSSTTTAYKTIEDLIGPTLYMKKKNKKNDYTVEPCTTKSVMKSSVEYVLLYFSASWCPPCQSFTPILADFYAQNKGTVEIIYISSDRNEKEFVDYYTGKMPYYTIHPFDTKASEITTSLRRNLPNVFNIAGIPTLVVLNIAEDTTCVKFISNTGRMDLIDNSKQYDKVLAKWKSTPKPLLSIEEGIRKVKKGDGSIMSMIGKVFQTLFEKPIYIFGIFYIYKFYGKFIYKTIMSFAGDGNGDDSGNSTTTVLPDPLLEPVPDDEF